MIPPKIVLTHSYSYITILAEAGLYDGAGPNFPTGVEGHYFIRTNYSPNRLYQYVDGAWVSLVSIQNWNGGYDTLYITRVNAIKQEYIPYTVEQLGNIKLNTLYAVKTEYRESQDSTIHNIHASGYYLRYYNDAGTGGFVPDDSALILGGPDVSGSTAPFPWRHIYGRWIHATDEINSGNLAGVGTRDVYANSDGKLVIYASSERYKTNINTLQDCSWLYKLNPVMFEWKDTARGKGLQLGLIAEEVHEVYPQLTWLDKEGKPEGVHYEWLGVPLIVEIKKLRKRVEALENQLKQNRTAA